MYHVWSELTFSERPGNGQSLSKAIDHGRGPMRARAIKNDAHCRRFKVVRIRVLKFQVHRERARCPQPHPATDIKFARTAREAPANGHGRNNFMHGSHGHQRPPAPSTRPEPHLIRACLRLQPRRAAERDKCAHCAGDEEAEFARVRFTRSTLQLPSNVRCSSPFQRRSAKVAETARNATECVMTALTERVCD